MCHHLRKFNTGLLSLVALVAFCGGCATVATVRPMPTTPAASRKVLFRIEGKPEGAEVYEILTGGLTGGKVGTIPFSKNYELYKFQCSYNTGRQDFWGRYTFITAQVYALHDQVNNKYLFSSYDKTAAGSSGFLMRYLKSCPPEEARELSKTEFGRVLTPGQVLENFSSEIRVIKEGYQSQTISYDIGADLPALWEDPTITLTVFLKKEISEPEQVAVSGPPVQQEQQQQMMGPTIVIAGEKVTGKEIEVKEYGIVNAYSTPDNAKIYLNDEFIGNTPATSLKLEPGTYRLRIKADGYKDYEEALRVLSNSTITIKAVLEALEAEPEQEP